MPAACHRLLLFVAVALALGWWLLMFLGTHLPMPPKTHVSVNDKLQHAGAYAGLAFLLIGVARAFRWRNLTLYLGVIAAGALYGVADELTQLLVPNRSAELLDWIADVTGLALGALAFAVADFVLLSAKPWARGSEHESTPLP
jgi:VanZ family protein